MEFFFRIGMTSLVYGVSVVIGLCCLWLAGLPPFFARVGGVTFLLGFPVLFYALSATAFPFLVLLATYRATLKTAAQWVAAAVFLGGFVALFAFLFEASLAKTGGYLFEPSFSTAATLQHVYQGGIDAHYDALKGGRKRDLCKIGATADIRERHGAVFTLQGAEPQFRRDFETEQTGFEVSIRGTPIFVPYDARRIFSLVSRDDCAGLYLERSLELLLKGDRAGAYLATDLSESLAIGANSEPVLRGYIQEMRKRITDTGYAPTEREPGVRWIDGVGFYEDEEGGQIDLQNGVGQGGEG